jgi:hypothetical protein
MTWNAGFEAALPEARIQPIHGDKPAYNLRVMDAARMFQVLICLPLIPQMPALGEAFKPLVEHWRTTPFAAGLD